MIDTEEKSLTTFITAYYWVTRIVILFIWTHWHLLKLFTIWHALYMHLWRKNWYLWYDLCFSLKLSVSVFCDTSYYRNDCSVKCVSTDHCGGHYTCDNQGKKLCKSGWEGADCTVQIPGSEADCSVYTGEIDFLYNGSKNDLFKIIFIWKSSH